MKKVIIGMACVLGLLGIQAQETNNRRIVQSVQQDVDLFFIVKTANGKESPIVRGYFIDNDDIKSLEMLTTTQVDSILGKSSIPNSRAIIVFDINPSVNLLNRGQILAHYNIPKKHWSLPLMLDGLKIGEPGTLLGDTSIVDSIRVENNDTHIAIYTKYYPSSRQKKEKERQEKHNREKP